ncbi:unnamed protein product [Miscanthus lutarioriparius]|uniref:AIPP2-like SPOC-like domain-containing protein n=1 Tax=Miscanthus lutarioriparius TaxID=422564 RepID=A0A811QGF1_9POAL|nr:unnamed protein product [Miscanthus lutarioriparius]
MESRYVSPTLFLCRIRAFGHGLVAWYYFEKGQGQGQGRGRAHARGSLQIQIEAETRSSGLWTETIVSFQDSILISKWDLIVVTELGTAMTAVSPKPFHCQWTRRSELEEIVAISYTLKHQVLCQELKGLRNQIYLIIKAGVPKGWATPNALDLPLASRTFTAASPVSSTYGVDLPRDRGYCLDPVIYDASSFEWLCDDCPPKHNEVPKSLEWNCDHSHKVPRWKGSRNVIEEHNRLFEEGFNKAGVRMFSRPQNMNDVLETRSVTWFHVPDDSSCDDHYSIQLGSIINEPNVNRVEFKRNDVLEEGESTNDHLFYQPESADGSSHSASDLTVEIQKTAGAVGPTMNTMECLDLSMEKDSCSFSLNCVEGFPQGTKPDLLPLINDVERSYPCVTDSSCPTVPNMEQKDGVLENAEQPHPLEMVNPDGTSHSPVGRAFEIEEQGAEAGLCASVQDVEEQVDSSSPASESWEQPVPLKVVILRPWHDVRNSILRSKHPSNYSQSMQGSDLYVGNMDVLDPSKEWLDSRLKLDEQGAEPGVFASVEYVEQTHPNFTDKTSPIWSSEEQVDGSSPTSESWEQPDLLEVVRPWDDAPNSILRSKPPSNYSQPMQGSDLDVGNMDVLDPSKERMDSRLMSNTVEPSSSSNGGGTSVEKDNTEKTECLSGMDTVTPELDNVQGSNPSAEPSSSSNGEGASAVEKHSAEITECLLGMGTLTPALHNVQALNPLTPKECLVSNADNSDEANDNSDEANRSDEVHRSCNDFNGNYYPKPVLKGRISKMMYPRLWFQLPKMWLVGKHHKWKMPLPSKHVSPRKATKSSFRKQYKGPNRHIPRHTKHQKTKLVMKDRNTDPAHIRSCRPSKKIDRTCLSASLYLSPKIKEVNDANVAEPRCSKSLRTFEYVMAKKRKRPVLSYDEDAKAMQMEVRMRRRHVKSCVMKQRRSAENSEEAMSPGNSNNQHANDDMKARKPRRANKDKKAPLGNASVPCTRNDAARGIMKIGQEYISLAAHLSNQACKEVQELSLSLPALMKVTKHSKLKAWPGRWKASKPSAECIGLYFFSDNMRELDQLVHYLTDHSLVLKYVVGFAKLLIFPSVFLPEQCQTFQGNTICGECSSAGWVLGKQVPQGNKKFVHHMGAK